MFSFLPWKKSFRFVFISALLTAAAIGVALVSAIAGQIGEYELAALGSKVALGLALVIVIYVVPRLAQNINFSSEFSVHVPNAGLLFFALILLVTILSLSSGNNLLYLVLAALLAFLGAGGAAGACFFFVGDFATRLEPDQGLRPVPEPLFRG